MKIKITKRSDMGTVGSVPIDVQTSNRPSGRLGNFRIPTKYIYVLVGAVSVFLMSLVFMDVLDQPHFEKIDTNYTKVEFSGKLSEVQLQNPSAVAVRDKENPVNGVMVTSEQYKEMLARKLVVVSINNHSLARPQYGLSMADMVLEVLAEGGITRYNAYFYSNQDVEKIGPIRSARSYMLEYFLGFDDPIFVHEGQASYPPQETAVPEINTLYHLYAWGIESMQTAASRYRDTERIYSAGYVHSLMTGFDLINPEIDRLGWRNPSNIEALKFKYDSDEADRGTAKNIEIKFMSIAGTAYYSQFEYDNLTNSYKRSVGGKDDIDALTGKQISPKNVIVEFHNYRDAMDGHSRIIIDMTGKDRAVIFRDGKMIEAYWVKDEKEDRTRYYDASGKEIELNRGQIWVSIAVKTTSYGVSDVLVNGEEI